MDLDKDRTVCGNYMPKFTYGFGGKLLVWRFRYGLQLPGCLWQQDSELESAVTLTIWKVTPMVLRSLLTVGRSPENPGSGWVNKANRKQTG